MDSANQGQLGPNSLRNLGNGHGRDSALQLFVQAKKRISDIFKDIGDCVVEVDQFVQSVVPSKTPEEVPGTAIDIAEKEELKALAEKAELVARFKTKSDSIREVLARNHIKVVFFGRTSNGKSTVINAMLRDEVLPSGLGHTTSCFIQVEGCDDDEASMLTEDSNQPKSIQSIEELGSALSSDTLEHNSLIRVLWPKSRCRLLCEDIVFLDSPGVGVSPDLDQWIDKFCLDADVFVLVANATSTLTQTEKKFFYHVSDRLSRPNVFVLQNHWDLSEKEKNIEKVKQQHIDSSTQFLADELQVVDRREAKDRVFFVSAREALVSRLQNDSDVPSPDQGPGFQARISEFEKFEMCISKSAVKTKFEHHTREGKTITCELRTVMEEVCSYVNQLQEKQQLLCKEKESQLKSFTEKRQGLITMFEEMIAHSAGKLKKEVENTLKDEIQLLADWVKEFDHPFSPEKEKLKEYKEALQALVKQRLGQKVKTKCSLHLLPEVEFSKKQMTEQLSDILPKTPHQQLCNQNPTHDFETIFDVNRCNLLEGFQENIKFQFSLGPTVLRQRFWDSRGRATPQTGTAGSPSESGADSTQEGRQDSTNSNPWYRVGFIIGSTAVVALATTPQWSMPAAGALVTVDYLWEYRGWTTEAQKQCLKQQFVKHAKRKLSDIVSSTSSKFSDKVHEELTSTASRLCRHAYNTKQQLEKELKQLDTELHRLQAVASSAETLRNKADFLDSELNSFCAQYLQDP